MDVTSESKFEQFHYEMLTFDLIGQLYSQDSYVKYRRKFIYMPIIIDQMIREWQELIG